jgi:predicted Zn-dependent protease
MAHELGHTFGLNHVEEPTAIMNPIVSMTTELTEEDRDEYYRVNLN